MQDLLEANSALNALKPHQAKSRMSRTVSWDPAGFCRPTHRFALKSTTEVLQLRPPLLPAAIQCLRAQVAFALERYATWVPDKTHLHTKQLYTRPSTVTPADPLQRPRRLNNLPCCLRSPEPMSYHRRWRSNAPQMHMNKPPSATAALHVLPVCVSAHDCLTILSVPLPVTGDEPYELLAVLYGFCIAPAFQ